MTHMLSFELIVLCNKKNAELILVAHTLSEARRKRVVMEQVVMGVVMEVVMGVVMGACTWDHIQDMSTRKL